MKQDKGKILSESGRNKHKNIAAGLGFYFGFILCFPDVTVSAFESLMLNNESIFTQEKKNLLATNKSTISNALVFCEVCFHEDGAFPFES